MHAMPLLTRLFGYFPGHRLGFAGREAGRLMREWATTGLRGDYGMPGWGDAINAALGAYDGKVLALRLACDRFAPPGSSLHLQTLSSQADWRIEDLAATEFHRRRPDHFGWLREPGPVVQAFLRWQGLH
jgi:predicted alpha/beta hydrolase